jgi:hypothetical protein
MMNDTHSGDPETLEGQKNLAKERHYANRHG